MKGEARPEICPADRFQRRTGGAPDRVLQWPKGAWSISRSPFCDQPVVLAMFVFSAFGAVLEPMAHARLTINEPQARQ
jgi:hypothetical protein